MICDLFNFTYDTYTKLLKLLKQSFRIVPFCGVAEAAGSYLILRHDVDASLEAALKMAKIECDLGIKSTYFVLFSYKFYNLLERDDLATLREISRLGHEIGLHYDVVTYESYGHDLRKTLESEIKLLGRLLGRQVLSIARHNVSLMTGEDPFKNIKKYINAYDLGLCSNYVSDSCRSWFLNDLKLLLEFKFTSLQLLIHPFLWTEDICERDVVLERLFQEIERKSNDYRQMWLRVWHENQKVKEYDRLVEGGK